MISFFDAPGTYYTTKSTMNMISGEAPRQLEIFLKNKSVTTLNHDWKDVLVIGEHKQSHHGRKELLLQITRYMRNVFTSQPTRRFIHVFFMHVSTMQLWVFDRSGAYSSVEFDIHEEPEKLIRALVGYAFMSNEELGLDTFIVRKGNKHTIIFENDVGGKKRKLELDQEPFVKQWAVCRGTTCFRTADHSNVVKFSWTSEKRPSESDHLRLARQKGLKGIANFIGYQSITSIDELRSGLVFGRPWVVCGDTTLEFTSDSRRSVVDRGHEMNPPVSDNGAKKRRSFSEDATIRKRSKPSSHGSRLQEEPTLDSSRLYELSNGKYDNRIFSCLAISPAGRALNDFNSILELLNALHDAIKAHRSLYLIGQILHRDISENNIIITNPEQADGFTGMLIDLDLAKPAGSSETGAQQTGTVEFMAIQVLRNAVHTYRHDLESFFYVLLWICGRRVWEKGFLYNRNERPREDVFRRWYTGSFEEIARSKQGDMHADGFEQILSSFPPALDCVKPLCTKIRRILFPLTAEGELDIGTPPNPKHLYNQIIQEFEAAISAVDIH